MPPPQGPRDGGRVLGAQGREPLSEPRRPCRPTAPQEGGSLSIPPPRGARGEGCSSAEVTVGQRGTGRAQRPPPLAPASRGPGPVLLAAGCGPRTRVRARACAGISLRPRAACSVCVLPPVFGAPPAAPRGDGWLRMGPRTSGAWRCGCSPLTGCWGPRHGLFEGVPGAKATWGFSFSFFPFRILQWDTSFRCQVDSLVLRHAHHLGGDPSVSSAPGTVGGH